jgi:A-factor biosynthesis repeat.
MHNRILLVVGDKFANYVKGKDAVTVSQLRGLLSLSIPLPNQGVTLLVPGQGLGDDSVAQLLKEAAASPNLTFFDFTLWHNLPKRATRALSHKHYPANTLISEPRQCSEDVFELHMMIDENCELMNDHQSGQHVQGMILIEAARQTIVAVTEAYLLPQNGIEYAFVLNNLSVSYSHYTFPVGALLRCNILEKSVDNPKRLSFEAEILVEQCGQVVSRFLLSIGAMEKVRISKGENMQALKAQANYLAYVAANMQEFEEPVRQVENM